MIWVFGWWYPKMLKRPLLLVACPWESVGVLFGVTARDASLVVLWTILPSACGSHGQNPSLGALPPICSAISRVIHFVRCCLMVKDGPLPTHICILINGLHFGRTCIGHYLLFLLHSLRIPKIHIFFEFIPRLYLRGIRHYESKDFLLLLFCDLLVTVHLRELHFSDVSKLSLDWSGLWEVVLGICLLELHHFHWLQGFQLVNS